MRKSDGYGRGRALTRQEFLIMSAGAGLLLAGCGGAQGGSGSVEFLVSGGDSPQMKEFWGPTIKEFEKGHQEIDIQRTTVSWEAAHDEIFNRLRAGDAPDLMKIGSRWINEFASLRSGLRSLEEYLTPRIREHYYPAVLGTAQSGGETYGLPIAYSTKALIYRTDLIDEPPRDWEETVSIAREVQRENPNIYGLGISAASHVSTVDQFSQFLYQAGGRVFDDGGAVAFDNDTGVEALGYYVGLYREHEVTPNPIDYNREELPTLFKSGKIAMMFLGPWGGEPSMGLKPDNEQVPYASAPLPAHETSATELVTDSLVMSEGTGNPDAAWQFLKYVARPEIQARRDIIAGGVPLMPREVELEPLFSRDAYWNTFIEMSEHGVPAPQPAIWQPFEAIIVDMVQRAMLGKVTPKQAINDAAKAIKDEQLEPKSMA